MRRFFERYLSVPVRGTRGDAAPGLMIELRTLGLVDLKGPDGREIRAVLTQPKRVALLAYLAVAAPRGFHRRDTLLGLFWPELDQQHARATLRKAVHALRHALGEAALVGRGDEELALAEDGVWCDATAFERALDDKRPGEALALYRGDFLQGLFISGAPEFEHWHEHEQLRLRGRAAAAAWAVAEERLAGGDEVAASAAARRALELTPDDEGALRRVITLLYRIGDRAGALHLYNEFALRLVQEYGVQPSAETRQLVEQVKASGELLGASLLLRGVREDHAAPAPVARAGQDQPPSHRAWGRALVAGAVVLLGVLAGAPTLRRWQMRRAVPVLAVGAIHDYSTRDTSGLARAIPTLLATNLARLRQVQVVSGARMYEIMAQLGVLQNSADDPVLGLAARQAGATELVEGALYRRPGGFRLDVERVELESGRVLAAYSVEGPDLFTLVDGATDSLAVGLGFSGRALRVADVTTTSPVAYQLYAAGLWAYYREGDRLGAHRLFRAALAEDSLFAMAAYYAAISIRWVDAAYPDYWPRAARLANRATDRERLLILGTWGHAWPGVDRVAAAETLASRYPAEPDGELLVGDGLIWLRSDYAGAVRHLRRVVAMDSLSLLARGARCLACDALELLIQAYAAAESSSARLRTAREWVQLQPRSARAWDALAATFADLGRYDEARAAFDTLVQVRGPNADDPVFGARLAIHAGDFANADRALRDLLRSGDERVRTRARWYLTLSLRHQGRQREAIAEARQLGRSHPGVWEYKGLEASALLELGRANEAAAIFDSLARAAADPVSPWSAARVRAWLLTHAAGALAAARDTAALAAVADSIDALAPRVGFARDRYFPSYARGLLLAARGRLAEAAALLRSAARSLPLGYTRVNLELARVALRSARPGEAIHVLQSPLEAGGFVESSAYTTRTELHLLLARAFDAAGEPDSAAAHYRWVLKAWAGADREFRARRDSVAQRLTALGR